MLSFVYGNVDRAITQKNRQTDIVTAMYLGTTHQSIFHHCHKLLVTQFAVTVSVKELKDNMYNVTVERLTSARLHCTTELTYTHTDTDTDRRNTPHNSQQTWNTAS